MSPERTAELKAVCAQMRVASNAMYSLAPRGHHHAFHEFCGLINEYIQLCETALAMGRDFTETSVHGSGRTTLPMQDFNLRYIREKLSCIYGVSAPALFREAP